MNTNANHKPALSLVLEFWCDLSAPWVEFNACLLDHGVWVYLKVCR